MKSVGIGGVQYIVEYSHSDGMTATAQVVCDQDGRPIHPDRFGDFKEYEAAFFPRAGMVAVVATIKNGTTTFEVYKVVGYQIILSFRLLEKAVGNTPAVISDSRFWDAAKVCLAKATAALAKSRTTYYL